MLNRVSSVYTNKIGNFPNFTLKAPSVDLPALDHNGAAADEVDEPIRVFFVST